MGSQDIFSTTERAKIVVSCWLLSPPAFYFLPRRREKKTAPAPLFFYLICPSWENRRNYSRRSEVLTDNFLVISRPQKVSHFWGDTSVCMYMWEKPPPRKYTYVRIWTYLVRPRHFFPFFFPFSLVLPCRLFHDLRFVKKYKERKTLISLAPKISHPRLVLTTNYLASPSFFRVYPHNSRFIYSWP